MPLNTFEQQYIRVRQKENRLYTDEQVKALPHIERSHSHYHEWLIRKSSARKLVHHLSAKHRELVMLEVGCGNGWLCSHLARIRGSRVSGIDINRTELDQAKRVFQAVENLQFLHGEIGDEPVAKKKFDVIVFAASIQYFPSLSKILNAALARLKENGEIHIIDSFFYKPSELGAARRRSFDYFEAMEFSEMSNHYFHHGIDELQGFRHKIFHDPVHIMNRLRKTRNPFHWICVYHA